MEDTSYYEGLVGDLCLVCFVANIFKIFLGYTEPRERAPVLYGGSSTKLERGTGV